MFIAHLPAGYLLAKTIRLRTPGRKAVMTAALLGAIAPDLDLFYFYTLDGRQHHHHSYWTHYPSVWFALMLLAWGASRIKPWSTDGTWLLIFSMSGFLHLLLDFIVGDIPLLAPWSMRFHALATVQAQYPPWWLNFLLHWSFFLELLIIAVSVCIMVSGRRKTESPSGNPFSTGIHDE